MSFLALTETHLNENILNTEIAMQFFTLFTADRKDRSHGGIAIYLREELAANTETLVSLSNGTTELLAVYLRKAYVVLITLYQPPNTPEERFMVVTTLLQKLLHSLPTLYTEVIITGDFNLSCIS